MMRMREKLIEVATRQFGESGFEGASTRDIASAADTTMSNITYHFGGKQGLYRAVGQAIVAKMRAVVASAPIAIPADDATDAERIELICAVLQRIGAFMLSEEAAPMARFVAREQQDPNSTMREFLTEGIHDFGLMLEHQLRFLRPEFSSIESKTTIFFLISMAMSLRSARLSLCIFMGVEGIDERLSQQILERLDRTAREVLGASSA